MFLENEIYFQDKEKVQCPGKISKLCKSWRQQLFAIDKLNASQVLRLDMASWTKMSAF